MTDPQRNRNLWLLIAVGSAAIFCVLIAVHIVSLAQGSAQRRQWAEDQVMVRGRALRQSIEAGGFRAPSGEASEGAMGDPGVILRQTATLLGNHPLWMAPPTLAPPHTDAPPSGRESVQRAGDIWIYAYGVPDGRTFIAVFGIPGGERQEGRTVLAALFEASALGGMLLLAGFVTWRALRRNATHTASGALQAPQAAADSPSTPAVASFYQSVVKELHAKKEELRRLHEEERGRAEDVEAMAAALCSNLDAGYLRFGEDGCLAGVNAAARSLLGLREFPRVRDRAEDLLREREEVAKVLDEVRATRSLALRDEVAGAPGILLQVAGLPLFNQLHQLKGFLLILRDHTGVYEMKRTLREREALSRLGEVAAGVAHEVRNALGTITTRLKLLGQDIPELSKNPSFQALAEESRGLEQVVQNLLFFAKPLPLRLEEVDLREILDEEAIGVRAQAPQVEVTLEGGRLRAPCDRESLTRAVRNLTRNALEAVADSPPGRRRMRLSTVSGEGLVGLRVEDTGPGVPEGTEASLFTPFFSQKPGGTGLGLAIARKVAREHGGDLVYFKSTLGGAGFELSLPAPKEGGAGPSSGRIENWRSL